MKLWKNRLVVSPIFLRFLVVFEYVIHRIAIKIGDLDPYREIRGRKKHSLNNIRTFFSKIVRIPSEIVMNRVNLFVEIRFDNLSFPRIENADPKLILGSFQKLLESLGEKGVSRRVRIFSWIFLPIRMLIDYHRYECHRDIFEELRHIRFQLIILSSIIEFEW